MTDEPILLTEALEAWCREHGAGDSRLTVSPIKGGGSCEMFRVDSATAPWVIRRAPLAAVSSTAHDVVREHRIITALQGQGARVPELIGSCSDPEVFGAPFYAMAFIDGEVIRRKLPERYLGDAEAQRHIGPELIDALVELHAVEWRGSDLENLARPDNFLERQVQRWLDQLESYRCRDLPGIDTVAQWLDRHRPALGELTVMHGDYKLDNAMFSPDLPPRILSLVDFEMTTVGDPLIDLAWAMIFWPEDGNLIAIAAPGSPGGMEATACQAPSELVARYTTQTGRDVSAFDWYQAFAAWKLAIVLEGSYAKFLAGESKNPNHEFFGFLIDQLLERAQRFAS